MIDALGIHIGEEQVYISGVTIADGTYNLSYYTILNYFSKNDLANVLNEWYLENSKEFSNSKISMSLPENPIMRVVDIDSENESMTIDEKIDWEVKNYLLNPMGFTYSYDIVGNKAIIAFADKDEILDFINSLEFNVSVVENCVLGLINILEENHSTINSISAFCENNCMTLVATNSGVLVDYKVIYGTEDKGELLKSFLKEVKDVNGEADYDIFLSGLAETTDYLQALLEEFNVVKLNPFISVGQTDEIISESNISHDGPMLPISISYALNCIY